MKNERVHDTFKFDWLSIGCLRSKKSVFCEKLWSIYGKGVGRGQKWDPKNAIF